MASHEQPISIFKAIQTLTPNPMKDQLQAMKEKMNCPICNGSGKAKYIDLSDKSIPDGKYDLNYLVKTFGRTGDCPDCSSTNVN